MSKSAAGRGEAGGTAPARLCPPTTHDTRHGVPIQPLQRHKNHGRVAAAPAPAIGMNGAAAAGLTRTIDAVGDWDAKRNLGA